MGGEKPDVPSPGTRGTGSPPHGRGKVRQQPAIVVLTGITPAWAGKRRFFVLCHNRAQDHPRMGGEKSFIYLLPFFRLGSPPHGRGKGQEPERWTLWPGITPAWAGKRMLWSEEKPLTGDHPRMGGEKAPQGQRLNLRLGSPPHGRGKVHLFRPCPRRTGITPAWAGKSQRFGNQTMKP